MKKILLALFILCTAYTCSLAQTTPPAQKDSTEIADSVAQKNNPILLGIGLNFGAATGQTNKLYSSSTGLSFKFEFPFSGQKLHLTLSAAYTSFSTKSTAYADTMQNGHYVPVEVGLKYFLYKSVYFEGDVGESLNINSAYMGYQSAFIYSPVIGISLPLKQKYSAIDISIRYESRIESAGNINQAALCAAYSFGL